MKTASSLESEAPSRPLRRLVALTTMLALGVPHVAHSAPVADHVASSSWASSRSIADHFGLEVARRLIHGDDLEASAVDDALRGIDRAVSLGTEDGVLLVVKFLADARGLARSDTRVLLAATRALVPFVGQRVVARTLSEAVLGAPAMFAPARSADDEGRPRSAPENDRQARLDLARATAARALALSGDAHAIDLLLIAARGGGPGQTAARAALLASPPPLPPRAVAPTPSVVALTVAFDDLRAANEALEATRSLEASMRAVGLQGSSMFRDSRSVRSAQEGTHDADPRVREAATETLVDLGDVTAPSAVRSLLEDDATAAKGVELAGYVSGEAVVGALAARIRVSSDARLRAAAIGALGHQAGPEAVSVLHALLVDPSLAGDAAEAIARANDASAWRVIAASLGSPPTRKLAARMAAARGRVFGTVPSEVQAGLVALAHAKDGGERAVGVGALVLLGAEGPERGLTDLDPRVRRAAAMGCEPTEAACANALLGALRVEKDAVTRLLLMRGLAHDGATPSPTGTLLLERSRGEDIDAALAVLAFARQAGPAERDAVLEALASSDPVARSHAARGLMSSNAPWVLERLAHAYDLEADAATRRSLVAALAARSTEASARTRSLLARVARFDPDPAVRTLAERALRGLPEPRLPAGASTVWLRVMNAQGEPPSGLVTATLLRADGLALPVVFDEDGYALTPAPEGPARLLLAPRVRAYEPAPHAE